MKRKTYEKKLRNFRYQVNQLPTSQKVRDFRIPRPDFGFVPCLLAAEPEDTPMAYCGAGAVCGGYGLPGSAVPVHLRRLYGQHPGPGDARLGDL